MVQSYICDRMLNQWPILYFVGNSDAMETDDKAGSSPAGKPTESVRLLYYLNCSSLALQVLFGYLCNVNGWSNLHMPKYFLF